MKKLTSAQKLSYWTKLGDMLGLSEATIKLSDYPTKEGQTISIDDETMAVEGEVKDGEYELEDGRILVITDGKLETIKDAPQAKEEEEVKTAEEEDPTAENQPDQAELESLRAENEALKAQVTQLLEDAAKMEAEKTELNTKLSAIESEPADKKVTLLASNEPAAISPAQQAWDRYNRK